MNEPVNVAKIEEILSVKAEIAEAEGVVKVSFPRTDIPIRVDNYLMKPFMGLTTWAAFQKGKKQGIEAMLMGDIVLFEDEVNPAMDAAFSHGLEVTALHNHFFFSQPTVYFMHLEGEGALESLATGVKAILGTIKSIRQNSPQPANRFDGASLPENSTIDGSDIEKIIGVSGQEKDGMFKIVIGREVTASCGCTVGKTMGINTWAAFGGNNDNAVVCGDFAVLEEELQSVLKTLRSNSINIVAIHNHMTFENPRMLFLHYWGKGKAVTLAQDLKSALDQTHDHKQEKHSNEHCDCK